ncbi:hypothetical protein C8Q74DRAFT_759774 [Fomes fomentarius]|nr:hypothetical protein C8Q74DRAFT_759774 [Fomes fomentarius]
MDSNAEGIPEQTFTKELNAKTTSLLKANADPTNWKQWQSSSVWTWADDDWQAFSAKWRDHNGPVYKEVDGARTIDLSDIRYLVKNLPPSILVRTCYETAVVATLQTAAGASGSGMIFTGQPGIGKTTFLLYLLVVLLQRKQVVLLTLVPSQPPLLFYHDGVYEATKTPTMTSFPRPKGPVLIWSLFEANEQRLPEFAYSAPMLFPVQAPSPNPKLYARWRKDRGAVLSAFPLWGFDELKQGLRLQREFTLLQEELGSMLETWQDHSHDSDPSLTYSRALQRLRVACGDKQPESVDVAVDVLLEASIAAFGLVARDVFRATCVPAGYDNVLSLHGDVYVGYEELKEILGAVKGSNNSGKHVTHRAVCIVADGLVVGQPVMKWSVTFKSDMIAKEISEKWADAQEGRVREFMTYLSAAPASQTLVGWFFEALAHRRILAAGGAEEYWSLKPMTLQKPSTFVLDTSTKSKPMIPKRARRRVRFDTQDITSERLELRDDEYYIPKIANFSLIDSFLVSFEPGSSAAAPSADLWLFQMTTLARHHRGSSRTGYDRIQNIISMLKKQLGTQTSHEDEEPPKKRMKSEEVEVRVHYVLACAAGKDSEFEQIQQWTLPPGLADKARGDGYLMELDVLYSTQAGG